MDSKDFLGVAEGKEEGTIINTLGRNIIIIIKVSFECFNVSRVAHMRFLELPTVTKLCFLIPQLNSQKQMKSWATIEKLNTKVVYDRDSDRYVGGFGSYLKCWNETIEDLKKVKKIRVCLSVIY